MTFATAPLIERARGVRMLFRSSGLARSNSFRGGVFMLAIFVAAAMVSQFWTPYPPMSSGVGPVFAAPSAAHLFGTDRVGADIFSRTLFASTTDVSLTIAVVCLALVVGTVWGAVAGYYGGWFDTISMRALEIVNAFPALLLAMLVIAVAGPGILNVIFVVTLLPLPEYVRLARAEVKSKKTWQFAEAARMVGHRPSGVLFGHLVPNSLRPLLSFASLNASWVAGTIGALGFLGLGIEPGSAEWGSMISRGQNAIITGQWWVSFFPGMAMFLLAGAFHFIGDGLADAGDIGRR